MTTTTSPLAGTYVADPIHSSFGFAVRYQGVSIYRGTFTDVQATLSDRRLEGGAKVESISIVAPEQFRAHVLGPEFFDTERHPEIRFTSTSIDLRDDGSAVVEGELTMKGITHPVTATGTWTAPQADAFGNTRAHLHLETQVDRTKWEMKWNAPLPSGGNALANEVTITVDLSLTEQAWKSMEILGIAGSLRRGSHNAKLLRAAGDELPSGVVLTEWDGLRGLPPFDEDLEESPPEAVRQFREAIEAADAVLVATPEYNASIPGVLKNALDWASRPFPENALRDKPAAVIGASTGLFGAVWAQAETRKVLKYAGAQVLETELAVGLADGAFDERGGLVDPELRARLGELLTELVREVAAPAGQAA